MVFIRGFVPGIRGFVPGTEAVGGFLADSILEGPLLCGLWRQEPDDSRMNTQVFDHRLTEGAQTSSKREGDARNHDTQRAVWF